MNAKQATALVSAIRQQRANYLLEVANSAQEVIAHASAQRMIAYAAGSRVYLECSDEFNDETVNVACTEGRFVIKWVYFSMGRVQLHYLHHTGEWLDYGTGYFFQERLQKLGAKEFKGRNWLHEMSQVLFEIVQNHTAPWKTKEE